jgi:hypothetical protein
MVMDTMLGHIPKGKEQREMTQAQANPWVANKVTQATKMFQANKEVANKVVHIYALDDFNISCSSLREWWDIVDLHAKTTFISHLTLKSC